MSSRNFNIALVSTLFASSALFAQEVVDAVQTVQQQYEQQYVQQQYVQQPAQQQYVQQYVQPQFVPGGEYDASTADGSEVMGDVSEYEPITDEGAIADRKSVV